MKNIVVPFSITLLFAIVLFSCAPVRVVSTQKEDNINYSAYKSFNFMDVSHKNDSLRDDERQKFNLLKNAIVKEMESIGYRQADNPDLWINIGISVEPKVQTRTTNIQEAPVYMGQRRYHWESEEVVVNKYKEGTVSIDIVDATENKRVWEGVVAGTVTDNLQKLEKRIDRAMELLFNKFPNK